MGAGTFVPVAATSDVRMPVATRAAQAGCIGSTPRSPHNRLTP
jgi:hypothetical protein